ncbi:MAG TPA: 1-acyl-sn-glycerol-3-phosphate acyltransferase [Elusimicrobia bacterium]|jgi:1-acyl-sn-glycerol-3-phosphate acyltransferase|nr:1-acyl-sn-glycerol-3-phosphate acyltransferase [Elusimicrobiota bacterium]
MNSNNRKQINYVHSFGKWFFWLIFKFFWRIKVYGHKNIPPQGGVIVAANHSSLVDPPVLGSAMKREANYLAKQELFRIPIFGNILRRVNAFPVKRGESDILALKRARRLLEEGKLVILFPEGTRNRTGKLLRGRPGIGILTVWTGVPIVPALIRNTNRLFHFPRLEVHFAPPLYFSNSGDNYPKDREYYQKITDEVMQKISEMKKSNCRINSHLVGIYG